MEQSKTRFYIKCGKVTSYLALASLSQSDRNIEKAFAYKKNNRDQTIYYKKKKLWQRSDEAVEKQILIM